MIGAVVLAAGRSQRFGHSPKLAAPLGNSSVLGHTLSALADRRLRPLVVVTGAAATRTRRIARASGLPAARLTIRHNPDYRHGMASSLRQGLAQLARSCSAAMICLGDMAWVTPRLIDRLLAAWGPGLDMLRPVHAGRAGHPVIVSQRLFGAIDELVGDRGAQPVLDRVAADRRAVLPAGPECRADIDTPAALRHGVGRYRRRVSH